MSKRKKVIKKRIKKREKAVKNEEQTKVWQPRITIIGLGGGGSAIVSEISKKLFLKKLPHLNKIQFFGANVDLQALKSLSRHTKAFYFGKELTHGLGCGMNPELGEKAAEEAQKNIEKILQKNDFCIFVTCLGGGAGSGAVPVFAKITKQMGILSWGIFTQPFVFEGKERAQIAKNALKKSIPYFDAYTVMHNQRIFKIIEQKTSLNKSLSAMNALLADTIEGLIETLYSPGLINLDFADIKAILQGTGRVAYLHSCECSGKDRAEKVTQSVLKNPLIKYTITGADRMLFNIGGAKDMKMTEVEQISKNISNFNPKAKIIFGVMQNGHYKGKIRITLLAVGCGGKKEQKIQNKPIVKPKKDLKSIDLVKKQKELQNKKNQKEKRVIRKGKKMKKEIIHKKNINPKKSMVRRNALDLQRQVKESEEKMMEEENKWDTPAFLREGKNNL